MRANKPQAVTEKVPTEVLVSEPLSYGETMAIALCRYGDMDTNFANTLNILISDLPSISGFDASIEVRNGIEILVPKDTDTATRRAEWLIQAIRESSIPEAQRAGATFSAWAKNRTWENPKQLVVGMIQVAIPGITLGRFKIKRVMPVLISDDIRESRDLELSGKISEATLGVIDHALRMSGGNIHKIEPDLGEWFFGGMELSFKSATESALTKIENELTDLGIFHRAVKKDGKPVVMAMSPAVNTTPWNLRSLN